MTAQEILTIFEKEIASTKKLAKVLLPIGVVLIVAGLIMYLMLAANSKNFGLFVAICGVLSVLGSWFGNKSSKVLEEELVMAHEVFTQKPKDLVWAYIYEYNNKGSKLIQVKLGLRNGKLLSINKNQLPNKDEQSFLYMLKNNFNPDIVLGYSKEMEYKFNNKQF